MLNLSELVFKAKTEELKEAVEVIRQVGTAMDNLAKTSDRVSAAVDKTSKAVKQGNDKIVKTTEDSSVAVEKNNKVLERQQDILENMARGFSKGQSSTLAYAKAVGATTAELEDMGRILQAQRTLMGANPFDRSAGAVQALNNELKILKEAQRQYNQENALSFQQMKDLAIDKQRLLQLYKMENLSFKELKDSLRSLDVEYNRTAQAVNQLKNSQSTADKAKRDSANANSYLAKEMERVRYATSEMNAELNRSTSNQLLKFERALKLSGLTLDEQKQKLNEYRNALVQMEKTSGNKQTDYISRALGPQITDIFVGLSTGQNPLTVMLQQGGQLRDQFALAGVAAQDMGKMMRTAAREMVSSVVAVAGAFGGLLGGAFIDAGKGVTAMLTKITLVDSALTAMNARLSASAATGNLFALSLQAIGSLIPTLIGTALAGTTVALVGFAAGLKQVITEEDNLAKQLALTGGALNLTMTQAVAYAKALDNGNVSTGRAIEVITEMAKAGNLGSDAIGLVTKAAVDMELYAGVSISDTVKAFSKMKEKPVESLIELAKQTGMVSKETLDSVIAFQKQGQQADASSAALRALADVNSKQVDRMKQDYSNFAIAIKEMGRSISNFFADVFKDVWYKTDPGKQMEKQLQGLNQRIKETKENLGLLGSFGDNKLLLSLEKERDALLQQLDAYDRKTASQRDSTAQNTRNADITRIQLELQKQLDDAEINSGKKKLSQAEYIARKSNEILEDQAKKTGLNLTEIKQNQVLVDLANKKAQIEWESANKTKKAKAESFSVAADNTASQLQRQYASELQTAQALSKAKLDVLKAEFEGGQILRFEYNDRVEQELKRSGAEQLAIVNSQTDAVNQAYTETGQKIVAAYLKLSPKDQLDPKNIEKFEAAMSNLNNQITTAGKTAEASREKINSVVNAKVTDNAKAHAKAMFEISEAYREFQKAEEDIAEQRNREKVLSEQLRWASPEQAAYIKATSAETERLVQAEKKLANAVKETNYQYEQAVKKNLSPEAIQRANAERIRAEEEYAKAVTDNSVKIQKAGTDAVLEYQRNQLAEFSNGLADAITTALFEGGKAGSKKLRNVIVEALRKPITVIINAIMGNLMNSLVGSIGSSVLGSAGSSLLGNIAGGAAGNLLGGGMGSFLGGGSLTGMLSNMWSGITTGFSTLFSQGIGAWFSQGTGLMSAGAMGGGLGALAGPIGALLLLATNWKKLFGRTLKDVGIQGTFGGEEGFTGQQYKFYEGGLFRSDKTVMEELDASATKTLKDSFSAMRSQIIDFANVLGLSTEKVSGFTSNIKISLMGLKDEEIQKKIQEALATANNEMAEQVIGTWTSQTAEVQRQIQGAWQEGGAQLETVTEVVEQLTYTQSEYAKEGEKAIDTLSRLATGLSIANNALDILGYELYDASLAGANLASKLVDAFGGLEKFTSALGFYYDNFYSQEEKKNNLVKQATEVLSKYNLTLPASNEAYRKLIESQDLTTDSGQELFAVLVNLAPTFKQITDITSEAANAERKLANERRKAIAEAIKSAEALVKSSEDIYSGLQKKADDAAKEIFGAVVGGVNLTGTEFKKFSAFADGLDKINQSIEEISKSPFASELANQLQKLNEVLNKTSDLLADQVSNARLLLGDASGAMQSQNAKIRLNYSDYKTSGAFNAALADSQALLAKSLIDQLNSNALRSQNFNSSLSYLNQFASNDILINNERQGLISRLAEGNLQVRDAMQDLTLVLAEQTISKRYKNTSTGLPAIAAARANLYDVTGVQSNVMKTLGGGRLIQGKLGVAYYNALDNLNSRFKNGKISAEEFANATSRLEAELGSLESFIITYAEKTLNGFDASNSLMKEGFKALDLYFGQLGQMAKQLSETARESGEAIAVTSDVIGRLQSFTDVFKGSAEAVIDGIGGMSNAIFSMDTAISQMLSEGYKFAIGEIELLRAQASDVQNEGRRQLESARKEGSSVRVGLIVAQAAAIAGSVMTTKQAKEVAQKVAGTAAFQGSSSTDIRNASLLLDGLKEFDAASFEKVFIRLSDSLKQGQITESQYATLFNTALDTFEGLDAEIKRVTDSFDDLIDAIRSLADELLVDQALTSLSPEQRFFESQRQYETTLNRAMAGDAEAFNELQSITKVMLESAKIVSTDAVDYNRVFGRTIVDLRNLEANTMLNRTAAIQEITSSNDTPENAATIEQLQSLRDELRAGLAVIAQNTKNTYKRLDEWTYNGLPPTEA